MKCSFVIMGRPEPKLRPRVNIHTGKAYTPAKTKQYETMVYTAWFAQSRIRLTDGHPLRASLSFWFKVPDSASRPKRVGLLSCGAWYTHKPDLDNLVKSVLDALNGHAYADDSAVVELHVTKRYAADNAERVEVDIEEI